MDYKNRTTHYPDITNIDKLSTVKTFNSSAIVERVFSKAENKGLKGDIKQHVIDKEEC